jgi:hypothetical protein
MRLCKERSGIDEYAWKQNYFALCPHCKAAGLLFTDIVYCRFKKEKYPRIKLCPDGFVRTDVDPPKWGYNPERKLRLHCDEVHGGKYPTCVTTVYVTKKDRAAMVKTGQK